MTYEYKGKRYELIPAANRDEPCRGCAFDDDIDACKASRGCIGTKGGDLIFVEALPEGWIRWAGGEPPVSNDTRVHVWLRHAGPLRGSEAYLPSRADDLFWHHHGDGGDIIAYRVAEEVKAEKPWLPDERPDWIEWNGGERPVPRDVPVEIVMRRERASRSLDFSPNPAVGAGGFLWDHNGSSGDIVAYRVADLAEKPAPGEKPTNPKDTIGIKKAPLSCVPMPVVAEVGVAMLEGAAKYGRHNFRAVGVRASVYFDATMRHLIAWWEGEDTDPDSGVSHITKALASLMVLRDAQRNGLCTDDRPPVPAPFYPELNEKAAAILERHADKDPKHYTKENIGE